MLQERTSLNPKIKLQRSKFEKVIRLHFAFWIVILIFDLCSLHLQ